MGNSVSANLDSSTTDSSDMKSHAIIESTNRNRSSGSSPEIPLTVPIQKVSSGTLGPDAVAELALAEMQACKVIFDNWGNTLDELPKTKEVHIIQDAVHNLQRTASSALSASYDIVEIHKVFSSLMAARLNAAAAHPDGVLQPDAGIIATGDEVQARSARLCATIVQMQEQLIDLVTVVENARVKQEKGGFWSKIVQWFKWAWGVVVDVLVDAINALWSPFIGSGVSGALIAMSSIASAASNAALNTSQDCKSSEEELARLVKFLRITIPREIKKAEILLSNASAGQAALRVFVELQTRQMRMDRGEARSAARQWQEVNERLKLISEN